MNDKKLCIGSKLFQDIKDTFPMKKNYYFSLLHNIYEQHHFKKVDESSNNDFFFRIVPVIFSENKLCLIKHDDFEDNLYVYGHITDRDLREKDLEDMIFSSLMHTLKEYYDFTMRELGFVENLFTKKLVYDESGALILAYTVKVNGKVSLVEAMLEQGYRIESSDIEYHDFLHKLSFDEILTSVGL